MDSEWVRLSYHNKRNGHVDQASKTYKGENTVLECELETEIIHQSTNCGKTQNSENKSIGRQIKRAKSWAPELYKFIWEEKSGDSLKYGFCNTVPIADPKSELWGFSLPLSFFFRLVFLSFNKVHFRFHNLVEEEEPWQQGLLSAPAQGCCHRELSSLS